MTEAKRFFRDDIQGLRALAVLIVIVFHYDKALLPGGYVGVDVFFVISGYLITNILINKKDRRLVSVLKGFYESRVRRILPAFILMVVIMSLLSALLLSKQDFLYFSKSLEDTVLFKSNQYYMNLGDYFSPAQEEEVFLHTWSLAIEMQFYLIYPVLFLLVPLEFFKKIVPFFLLLFVGISEYQLRVLSENQSVYYSLYARIPEFLAGAAISIYGFGIDWSRKKSDIYWLFGFVCVVAAACLLKSSYGFPGLVVLLPVLGAALMISGGKNSRWARLFNNRLVIWVGALSYSLYLWHWPVLAVIRYATGETDLSVSLTIIFVVLTIMLSILSFYTVESFFIKKNSNKVLVSNSLIKWGWGIAAAAIIFLVPTGIEIVNKKFAPPPLSVEYTRYSDPEKICHGAIRGSCIRGDKNSAREILVVGDSHGAMLNHFFDEIGNAEGFKARIVTASSCVTIKGFDYQRIEKWGHKPCLSQIEIAEKFTSTADVIVIAGKWSKHIESEKFQRALSDYVQHYVAQGKKVILLSQVPKLKQNPLRMYRWEFMGLNMNAQRDSGVDLANAKIQKIAQNIGGAHYLALDHMSVFDDVPVHNQELIYFDKHHLNEIGSKKYAEISRAEFMALLSSLI